ncbi:MAG: replication-associated recombination protein A [Clostridia bacterium]|nr:replication-associated recombination protein A [Clostridia bacterium]
MDLFDFAERKDNKPLADRLRPTSFDNFVGQKHLVGAGSLLRRAITADRLGSCIFYGPPGTGKTTLANIIANQTSSYFAKLNAVTSGVADAKAIIEKAVENKKLYGRKTYLLLDECHRWNKAQSDCVLGAIESGDIIFVGSTTENPYTSMTKAIVSRCRIFEFRKLSEDDIVVALKNALVSDKGLLEYNVTCDDKVLRHFAWAAGGDLRSALNALELAVLTTEPDKDGKIIVDMETAEQSIQQPSLSVDESLYYDMISAFIKSMRGSDADAALFWSERLIQAGCDPLLILRRVMIHASEDVGMADPRALVVATSAMTAFTHLGLPEGRIPMAEAIIYVAEASKSNSVVTALERAEKSAKAHAASAVPLPLRDVNYKTEEIKGYKYPHSYGGWVEQQYLPDEAKDDVYYEPSDNGYEKTLVRAKVIKGNKG